MYNTQEIAKRIKNINKTKNEPLGTMLSKLEMGINTVSELGKGKQISYLNFAKIADYLNVSVDYLLGRTDEQKIVGGNSIKTGDINGDNNANINTTQKDFDEESKELVELINSLSLLERSKVVLFIDELKNK